MARNAGDQGGSNAISQERRLIKTRLVGAGGEGCLISRLDGLVGSGDIRSKKTINDAG